MLVLSIVGFIQLAKTLYRSIKVVMLAISGEIYIDPNNFAMVLFTTSIIAVVLFYSVKHLLPVLKNFLLEPVLIRVHLVALKKGDTIIVPSHGGKNHSQKFRTITAVGNGYVMAGNYDGSDEEKYSEFLINQEDLE